MANQFACKNQLRMISGSDFLQLEDLGRDGIEISQPVSTSRELATILKANIGIKLIEA
jgi:hypothetical protein